MVWVGGGAEAWCSAARSGLRIGLPCARPHCAAHPTLHSTTPPTLISLRNRELSSVELRSLDFEDAPGSASRTDPALERTIEALYVEAEESRLAAAGRLHAKAAGANGGGKPGRRVGQIGLRVGK